MKSVFADTHYFLALLNPADNDHQAALDAVEKLDGRIVTTDWIICELLSSAMKGMSRRLALNFFDDLQSQSDFEVVRSSAELFDRGLALYRARVDKEWSLTDCISFTVMKERRIRGALTADHHFEQAGFKALLRTRR